MQWYYAVNGQQQGPVEQDELVALARDGKLRPGDLVWNSSMGNQWAKAATVPGLFDAAGAEPWGVPPPVAEWSPDATFKGQTPNRDLMASARLALTGKWGLAVGGVLVYFLVALVCGVIPYLGNVISFVIGGPLMVGWYLFYLTLSRRQTAGIAQIFDGFKMFGNAFLANLLVSLLIFAWLLPAIGVGIVAAQMAGRLRREANVGARTAAENASIAAFGQRLGAVSDRVGTSQATCEEVAALLGVAAVVLTKSERGPQVMAAAPADPGLSPLDIAAADWALERGEPAGRGTATLAAADWQFHPLKTSLGVLAVLGISAAQSGPPLAPERRVLFATLLGQAALAHERLQLEQEARRAEALQQRDDLRVTLISALGHDLKTPLTAVVASADTLAGEYPQSATAKTLRDSAWRLRRLFNDLVEMTRIDSGSLPVRRETIDLTDALAAAVHDLRRELAHHRLVLAVPASLPLVEADPRMLHHMLVNLLDNAAKYAPPGTAIRAEGLRSGDGLALSIIDEGPGLPPGAEGALFDRFHRGEGSDSHGGTGLGLAIVKGFGEAMGLSVSARNRSDGHGSCFTVFWPEALVRRTARGQDVEAEDKP